MLGWSDSRIRLVPTEIGGGFGLRHLVMADRPSPQPGPGQVRVRIGSVPSLSRKVRERDVMWLTLARTLAGNGPEVALRLKVSV